MSIEKIEIAPIRDAFRHEALNFTYWLEQNIEALSERLGLQLNVLEREKAVGPFNVDLLCEDEDGTTIIIENQLERSDHDHLGKMLTYMVNLEAKTAIWVTTEMRQEHLKVINWLNEISGADMAFYAVKVEAIRIAKSPFAPLFTVLAKPDRQIHEIGEKKKELAERHVLREAFWTGLLEYSKTRTKLASNRSPTHDHWLSVATGRSGINYNYLILKNGAGVDLYIDIGDQVKNKALFDQLHAEQEAIEREFGEKLDWRRLDNKRASRVVMYYEGKGSLYEEDKWEELQAILIDTMIRFDRAFRSRINRITL